MATFTLTRDTWTDLGPAPFRLFVPEINDAAVVVISDAMPAAGALGIRINGIYWQGFPLNGSAAHVWARAARTQATATTAYATGGVSSSTDKPPVGATTVTGTVPAGATATCKKNGTVQGAATVTPQGGASYTLASPLVAGDQVSFPWSLTGESPVATVTAQVAPLAITGADGTANIGDTASFTPTISGGTAPYTVTATGLPPGRSITNAATGLTTGGYTTAGTYSATYTVTDSTGATASFTRSVTVASTSAPGTIGLSTSIQKAGNAYTFTFIRTGDTSSAQIANYSVAGSTLNGATPAIASDFGGSFPSGVVSFAAGQASKTVTITPSTNVEPE